MTNGIIITDTDTEALAHEIGQLIAEAQQRVALHLNTTLLTPTGISGSQLIVEHEQHSYQHAEYGRQPLREVARRLTRECSKGLSVPNLQFVRRLYETYPIQQAVSVELDKTHYSSYLFQIQIYDFFFPPPAIAPPVNRPTSPKIIVRQNLMFLYQGFSFGLFPNVFLLFSLL